LCVPGYKLRPRGGCGHSEDGRNREAAADRLADALPTVCAQAVPEEVEVEGRPVACHRYDPEMAGEPQPR
jgi:hypothetical protein